MKHILKEGEISVLLPEGQGGALSGEVHLVKHDNKKYVVRKCDNIQTAKYYEEISKKLERYNFLPKLLGRFGKDVLYEFIEGRDLRHNEKSFVFEELGKIGARVNSIAASSPKFNLANALNELVSGKYAPSRKVLMRRKRSNIRKNPRAVLQKKEAEKIKKLYKVLLNKTKAKFSLDLTDYVPGNFRLRKGKIYLVDVEAIKPAIKGMGIAKCFRGFCNTERRKGLFIKGYSKISSIKFLNSAYLDICHLLFAVQALNFKVQVDRDYTEDLEKINGLLIKYKI